MGSIYVPYTAQAPQSAMAILGDFALYAGAPNEELAAWFPQGVRQMPTIAVAHSPAWHACLEACLKAQIEPLERFAFPSHAATFDRDRLGGFVALLPSGYKLVPIDAQRYAECLLAPWSRDFVANYPSYELYAERGLGWVALCGEEIVAGASSYASSLDAIEIQVETAQAFRRQGLARACCARLILDCLDRGIEPGWDAANKASLHLAQQLGYRSPRLYRAYVR